MKFGTRFVTPRRVVGLERLEDARFCATFDNGQRVRTGAVVGTPAQCATDSTTDCFGAYTELTIPAASFVSTLGNPFYNGTTFNPYPWAMSAQYANGSNFKLNGVYHIDGTGAFQQLLKCDDPLVGGAPSVAYPLCYDTLNQLTNKKMLTATGRGLENGALGWN